MTAVGFALARRRGIPLLAETLRWPDRSDIDASLVTGAVLFGVGWGLVGLCPGPALVNLAGLSGPVIVFVIAMAVGMAGYGLLRDALNGPSDSPQHEAAIVAPESDG